jgi:arylsulfatase
MTTVIGVEAKALKGSKPNIIIIMPDDSSYGNHSCFGNPVIKTPNIDTLKGTKFAVNAVSFQCKVLSQSC